MEFKIFAVLTAIVVVVVAAIAPRALGNELTKSAGATLDRLFKDYDKRFRPNYGGPAVEVGITAFILAVPEIDSLKQEWVVDLNFRQLWNDPRLKFDDVEANFTLRDTSQLWTPHTFILNEVSGSVVEDPADPNMNVRLSKDGNVLMNVRKKLHLSCPMDFSYFPFDEQTCIIEIENFGFTVSEVSYEWRKGSRSVEIFGSSAHMEFVVMGHRLEDHTVTSASGTYPRLRLEILFKRVWGRYGIEFFYPSMFLALFSFLTLYVADVKVSVGLSGLVMGVTIIFLAITSGTLETPFVSSKTCLDTFSSITNTFIFISLSISTFSLYLAKNKLESQKYELNNLASGSGQHDRLRLQNTDSMDEEGAFNSDPNSNKTHVPPTRLKALCFAVGRFSSKILPFIKILLIVSYLVTIFIFWVTVPFAQNTFRDEDPLLSEDWIMWNGD